MAKRTNNKRTRHPTSIVAACHGIQSDVKGSVKHIENPKRQRVEASKDPVREPDPGYTGYRQAQDAIKMLERDDKTGKKRWTIMHKTPGAGGRKYFIIDLPDSEVQWPGTMVTEETAPTQVSLASSDVVFALADTTLPMKTIQTSDDKSAKDYGQGPNAEGSPDGSASPPPLGSTDTAFEEAMSFLGETNCGVPDSSHSL